MMQTAMHYRGYEVIEKNSRFHVIEPDSGAVLTARSLDRMKKSIDDLWSAAETGVCSTRWMRKFVNANDGEIVSVPRGFCCKEAALTAIASLGMILTLSAASSALDLDRDGKITVLDVHHLVNLIAYGTMNTTRIVEINGKPTRITFGPHSNPNIDYSITIAME